MMAVPFKNSPHHKRVNAGALMGESTKKRRIAVDENKKIERKPFDGVVELGELIAGAQIGLTAVRIERCEEFSGGEDEKE